MLPVQALVPFYGSILLPYLLYTFAYRFPRHYTKILPPRSVEMIGVIFKVISNCMQAWVCIQAGVNWGGAAIGFPLLIVGQWLNSLVYKKLGNTRVYYGYEFGLVPSDIQTCFPFTIHHAQYKGCVLSALGCFLAYNESLELTLATIGWFISFFFILAVEDGPCGSMKSE
jgi:protein-S-isoprenylcysteine O-methyltransferase Ste14